MSGLLQSIGVQAQSLNAQSDAINITGKNLANVANPNYSRETANIVSTADGGAEVADVSSARDQILDSQIMQQLSAQGSLSSQSDIANTIQSFLGENIDTATDQSQAAAGASANSSQSGLSSALDNFFNAFTQLAADPSQESYKQTALSSAQELATQLNNLSQSVSQTSASITTSIDTQAQQAQGYLSDIAALNGQIAKIEVNAPGSALDLRDQRQADIEKLSSLMNVTVSNSPDGLGQVNITSTDAAGNAVSLVNDTQTAGSISYTGDALQQIASLNGQIAAAEAAAPGSSAALVAQRTADIAALGNSMAVTVTNSPDGLDQVNLTTTDAAGNTISLINDTSVVNAPTVDADSKSILDLTGGSIAGYESVRAGTLSTVNSDLNAVANQLVTSVNAAYGDFFTTNAAYPAQYRSAGDIQVDPAVTASTLKTSATGNPGANDIATAIANIGNTTFSTGNGDKINGTLSDYYNSQVVTAVGQQISSLTSQQDTNTLVYNNLISQRQSESGVSTDEEASNLMIFQNAYEGIARVISVMDTLLNTVVTGL